jgi:hypothetical protein
MKVATHDLGSPASSAAANTPHSRRSEPLFDEDDQDLESSSEDADIPAPPGSYSKMGPASPIRSRPRGAAESAVSGDSRSRISPGAASRSSPAAGGLSSSSPRDARRPLSAPSSRGGTPTAASVSPSLSPRLYVATGENGSGGKKIVLSISSPGSIGSSVAGDSSGIARKIISRHAEGLQNGKSGSPAASNGGTIVISKIGSPQKGEVRALPVRDRDGEEYDVLSPNEISVEAAVGRASAEESSGANKDLGFRQRRTNSDATTRSSITTIKSEP